MITENRSQLDEMMILDTEFITYWMASVGKCQHGDPLGTVFGWLTYRRGIRRRRFEECWFDEACAFDRDDDNAVYFWKKSWKKVDAPLHQISVSE